MLRILNWQVYDLVESVVASGNAMRLTPPSYTDEEFQKGLDRMKRLIHVSDNTLVHCHKNALCGIRVNFDVVYPQYWTPEAQRYHFMDIVTSSSKMHRLHKMDLRKACNKYVDPRIIEIEQEKVDRYNRTGDYFDMMDMISNCPMGLELFERLTTNYLQLSTIYHQRIHHKLREDWVEGFCAWIEQLPYAQELIIGETVNQTPLPH